MSTDATETPAPPASEETPDKENTAPNLIRFLLLAFGVTGRGLGRFAAKNARRTAAVLILAILIPVVCVTLGTIIGACGGTSVARGLNGLGALIAAVLLSWAWVRVAVGLEMLALASATGHGIVSKLPKLTRADVAGYQKWFRGILVWVMGFGLVAAVIPIWNSLGLTMTLFTAALILSAMAGAGWFTGKWMRLVYGAGVMLIGVWVVFQLCAPGSAAAVSHWLDSRAIGLNQTVDRNRELEKKRQADEEAKHQAAMRLLDDFAKQRQGYLHELVNCEADPTCTPAQRQVIAGHLRDLDRKAEAVREGRVWEETGAAPDATAVAASLPTPLQGSANALPPPPPGNEATLPSPSRRFDEADRKNDSAIQQELDEALGRLEADYPNTEP